MKVKAFVTRAANDLFYDEVDLDEPKVGEVRVKNIATGVCHTDAGALGGFIPVDLPAVLGHEGVGIVDAVGPGVQELKVGDRVIMSFPSCGTCEPCKNGHPYACHRSPELFFWGNYKDGTHRLNYKGKRTLGFFGQSSFAEYSVIDERNCVKVDGDVDIKPLCSLGCGIQTGAGAVLNRLKPNPGSSLVVFGCGAVGMSAIMAAKIAGCSTIIGVDAVPSRLELALECGATHVLNGKECNAVEEIRKITNGGANYSVECSGAIALCKQALDCLDIEGTVCIVSVTGGAELEFKPEMDLMTPCRTITGIVEGGSNPKVFIPELIQYYKEGRLPVDKLAKYYKFSEIEQAFEDSHSGAVIKPILLFDED